MQENISGGGQSEFPPGARTVLHYVYLCLFSPGVRESVTNLILEMTLDLLDNKDSEVHVYTIIGLSNEETPVITGYDYTGGGGRRWKWD